MLDGDVDVSTIPPEEDPFWEPIEDLLLGSSNLFLQSLAYVLDFDDDVEIRNFKGGEEGSLKVHLLPCNSAGRILGEEDHVENPTELLGKPFYFKVLIKSAELTNPRYKEGMYVKYSVKGEGEVRTDVKKGTKAQISHSHYFSFPCISQHHLDFFNNGCIIFFVYVVQTDVKPDPNLTKLSTKELRQIEQSRELEDRRASMRKKSMMIPNDTLDIGLFLVQRKCERLEQKEKRLQELCREWKHKPESEKSFQPFYNSINALAFSNGKKLKARVQLVTKILASQKKFRQSLNGIPEEEQASDLDVFVFGENEQDLEKQANENGGYLPYQTLSSLYGANTVDRLIESKRLQQRRKSIMQGKMSSLEGANGNVQTSRTCLIQ